MNISSTTILRRSCFMFTRFVRRSGRSFARSITWTIRARLQTVSREENPLYYDLILRF